MRPPDAVTALINEVWQALKTTPTSGTVEILTAALELRFADRGFRRQAIRVAAFALRFALDVVEQGDG